MEIRHSSSLKETIQQYQLWVFFGVAFAISWVAVLLTVALAPDIVRAYNLAVMVAGFGPALAALVVLWLGSRDAERVSRPWLPVVVFLAAFALISVALSSSLKDALETSSPIWSATLWVLRGICFALVIASIFANQAGVRAWARQMIHWRVKWYWYLVALLLPPLISLGGLGVGALMGIPMGFSSGVPADQRNVVYFTGFFTTLLVAGPLGLEAGWRGFALPRLQLRTTPLAAALILGLVETLWFLPLYYFGFYPGGMEAFFLRFLLNIYMSVLYTWLYNRTGGSVLLVVLMHTSFNNSLGFWLPYIDYIFIAGYLAAGIVIFWDQMWSKKVEQLPPAPAV